MYANMHTYMRTDIHVDMHASSFDSSLPVTAHVNESRHMQMSADES